MASEDEAGKAPNAVPSRWPGLVSARYGSTSTAARGGARRRRRQSEEQEDGLGRAPAGAGAELARAPSRWSGGARPRAVAVAGGARPSRAPGRSVLVHRRGGRAELAPAPSRWPASIMEGLSRSIPRQGAPRRSHDPHHVQPPPPLPPQPPLVPEELFFLSVFEQYGGHHPFFYGYRFADALRAARRVGKLVFVYLHDPTHPYTEPFCRRMLCADVVVEFLDANFVSWGAVAGAREGPGMVASLQPGSFPFCAVVAPVFDESIAVLQQVEGPVSPSELVEILQRTIDEQGAAFRPSRPVEQVAAAISSRAAEEEERRWRSALKSPRSVLARRGCALLCFPAAAADWKRMEGLESEEKSERGGFMQNLG